VAELENSDAKELGGGVAAPRGQVLHIDCSLPARLGADGDLQFKSPGGWLSFGRFGAVILELFAHPRAYVDAFQILSRRASGQAELQELLALVHTLTKEEVLLCDRPPDDGAREHRSIGTSIHIEMLNDVDRTGRYLEAISSVVRPGDVVLDLGAGTGVLTLAAARAGARKVYAVEVSDDVQLVREICDEYIHKGVVQPIQDWSTSVKLPERADVLVTETIGKDPFGEDILELTMDARRRLLTENPRLIPRRLRVMGLPVTIPEHCLGRHRFTERTVEKWARLWGQEFRSLSRVQRDVWKRFHLKPQETRDWPALALPVVLADIDFASVDSAEIDESCTTDATIGGYLNGVVVFFDLDLGGGSAFSTNPAHASPSNHWSSPVWCVVDGRHVEPGEKISIRYSRIGGRARLSCW
jgi:protein arginine N-methyltransferase 1